MRTHVRHRFNENAELVLEEIASDNFHVTYLTREPNMAYGDACSIGEDEFAWYSNNSDKYASFSDALTAFNKRRTSDNPFDPVTRFSA
jgi:thiamine pyrophosphokinase